MGQENRRGGAGPSVPRRPIDTPQRPPAPGLTSSALGRGLVKSSPYSSWSVTVETPDRTVTTFLPLEQVKRMSPSKPTILRASCLPRPTAQDAPGENRPQSIAGSGTHPSAHLGRAQEDTHGPNPVQRRGETQGHRWTRAPPMSAEGTRTSSWVFPNV